MLLNRTLTIALALLFFMVPTGTLAEGLPADYVGETVGIFETTGDANQGVAVDENYIYAVTNRRITKMDKHTGEVSVYVARSKPMVDGQTFCLTDVVFT